MFKKNIFNLNSPRFIYLHAVDAKPVIENTQPSATDLAEQAKTEAISEALASNNGDDLLNKAQTKLDKIGKNQDADQQTIAEANIKLQQKLSEFRDTQDYIVKLTTAKKLLASTQSANANNRIDFLPDLDAAKQAINNTRTASPEKNQIIADLDAQIKKIETTAKDQYNSDINRANELVAKTNKTAEDLINGVILISTLESHSLNNFRGAPTEDHQQLSQSTADSITSLVKEIRSNGANLDDQIKDTFENLVKAGQNYDNAHNNSEAPKGWKEGSEQYLAAAIAETKARQAYSNLPTDLQVHTLADINNLDSKYAGVKPILSAALTAWNEGLKYKANINDGDLVKATNAFNTVNKALAEAANSIEAKPENESAQKAREKTDDYRKNNLDTIKNVPFQSYFTKKYQSEYDAGQAAYEAQDYQTAAEQFELAYQKAVEAKTTYDQLKSAANEKFHGAIERIKTDKNLTTSAQFEQVVKDYLSDTTYLGTDPDLSAILKSFAFTGTLEKDFGAKQIGKYTVSCSYESGRPIINIISDPNSPTFPLTIRDEYSKEQLNTSFQSRIIAAHQQYESGDHRFGLLEKNIQDYLRDTKRNLTPKELDQINGQVFTVIFNNNGVAETAKITINAKDEDQVEVMDKIPGENSGIITVPSSVPIQPKRQPKEISNKETYERYDSLL